MSNNAKDFIQERCKERAKEKDSSVYTNVSIRLDPKYALMLQSLSKEYNFSISTSFTDLIKQHLIDIAISLDEKDFKNIISPHDGAWFSSDSALKELQSEGIIQQTSFDL